MSGSRFTIIERRKTGPDHPDDFTIGYNPVEDILWIGRSRDPAGVEVDHGQGDILIYEKENVVITINNVGPQQWFVSSVALTQASRHPLWADIFRGLEFGLRERRRIQFFVDPCRWELR